MDFRENFKASFFQINEDNFEEKALVLFDYQRKQNPVYKKFIEYLKIKPEKIQKLEHIPFIPIELFKNHSIITGDNPVQAVFESSGTTGQIKSRHFVNDTQFYDNVSIHFFEQLYGSLTDFHILALLPSYLERNNSSLVFMVNAFMQKSKSEFSGFYLDQTETLVEKIHYLKQLSSGKILLIGVSFALLDLAEAYKPDLEGIIVMETGGMKGRRTEIIREELHSILKKSFNVEQIHSEYGMTELLSQAYSLQDEIFESPAWMRVFLRDLNDPLYIDNQMRNGAINVIDLANIDSCAFIATQDIGSIVGKNKFKILGRTDNSDIRGCNLLVF